MLLLWHDAFGSDDEQATEDELCARVLYYYEGLEDKTNKLQNLHLIQGLLAFVRTLNRNEALTTTTEWVPEWASVTLSRRRFFILEVEQRIFMALKDHRPGFEALVRELYGMFRLFHGSIESNLRLLPSVEASVEADTSLKKYTDGMEVLMDIDAVRKRLRKLQLVIDSQTDNKSVDDTNENEERKDIEIAVKTVEAELEALLAQSPLSLLQKKCAKFFPTLLQALDARNASGIVELQGLSYFPMDQHTFISLQSLINGLGNDFKLSDSSVDAEKVEKVALFFKGNHLWSSIETATVHLLYKFLRLREERGMTLIREDYNFNSDDSFSDSTPTKASELWMTNAYEDSYLPIWSSKLSYTECDVVAQGDSCYSRMRMAARSLHKQHPVSLSSFLSQVPSSRVPSSRDDKSLSTPVSIRRSSTSGLSQSGSPLFSPASLTHSEETQRNKTKKAILKSAIKARARSISYRNAGIMLKNGYFSKFLNSSQESPSETIWSPFVFPLNNQSSSTMPIAPREIVAVWHEEDLTMIMLLPCHKATLNSGNPAPSRFKSDTLRRLKEYLDDQQRFRNLAQLISTRYNTTFARKEEIVAWNYEATDFDFCASISTLQFFPPFLYINRVNLAFRMQNIPRLLKAKEIDLFPSPSKLLPYYFPASLLMLVNELHAELHRSTNSGDREICVRMRHAGWVLAKRSETSRRELYVFFDNRISSVNELAGRLLMTVLGLPMWFLTNVLSTLQNRCKFCCKSILEPSCFKTTAIATLLNYEL
ncbi:hypothetical protein PsorP6_005406 [Peronosclerospora sorghi]|uniref:Uncharacterized protein n=1 Tax=Peronosclerospora sorghi TaxID=230839 RepID=A0ACC0W665_9STRA|nr:hypothetical protein PsorP6_005406 [Peronosclerospora sorghi]